MHVGHGVVMDAPPDDRLTASTAVLPVHQMRALRTALTRGHGTITGAELKKLGIGTAAIRRLVLGRVLLRVARSAFVDGALHHGADASGRHVLRATAIARTWPSDVLVSHTSAALMHGLPLTSRPDRVHGCRRATGQHRKAAAFTIHTGYSDARHTTINGVEVLEPRFVIMGVAELEGRDEAVLAGDAALHRGMVSRTELTEAAARRPHHPVHATYTRAVELMDGRAESPGESRSRLVLTALGYRLVPQVVIREDDGTFLARVDFLLEGTRVVVEFDGMQKYASHEDLVAEKRREMRLRRAGYVVVRLVWSDLGRPDRVRALIEGARAAARGSL